MRKHYILVIDAGTGAGRVILFDLSGNIISSSYREWTYKKLAEKGPGAVEFECDDFWQIISELTRDVINSSCINPLEIAAVTTTSQRQGMVYINQSGHEIFAAPNMDIRGKHVIPEIEKWEKEIFFITGLPMHGMYGLPRLKWISTFDQSLYSQIYRVMMISDWIAYRLSGVCASEPSVASSSQLFDVKKGSFSEDLMDLLGLRKDIFPDVFIAGTPIGTVTGEASKTTGIPSGTPVSNGGGDTHAGVLGMGLYHPGEIAVVAGTTTPVILLAASPIMDKNAQVFTNCYVLPNCWCLEANAGSTGLSLRWVKDVFMREKNSHENPFALMEEKASEIPIGANGMVAYIGMKIAGIDSVQNLGGFIFPVPWDIEDFNVNYFYKAALETNIFSIRANVDYISSVVDKQPDVLHLCGGQSNSPTFARDLADVNGIPVNVYKVRESTALGACLSTACGIGLFKDVETAASSLVHLERTYKPDQARSKEYIAAYNRWLMIYQHLASF